jgi:hypothetical protein
MSDQDWPPARGTVEEFETAWQRAMADAPAVPIAARCPLMPAERHCFHEQLRLWDDPFPPPVVCCWCGLESADLGAIPVRHGPHGAKE